MDVDLDVAVSVSDAKHRVSRDQSIAQAIAQSRELRDKRANDVLAITLYVCLDA